MIRPEEIRRKALNLYRSFLVACLDGNASFFPRIIPSHRKPAPDDLAAAVQAMRRLRDSSKEVLGFGYAVEWREVNSRRLGRNQFPTRILFETEKDYLRFIGKQREFAVFTDAVDRLRAAFPLLEAWVRSNVQAVIEAAPDLEGLLHVVRFLHDHPRPNLFARELPVPVDTKFVERHRQLLREWLDVVLPPHTIRADENHFERRYGLRYAEPHLPVRLLDPHLEQELGFPCSEFSLPLYTLAELPVRDAAVFVVENKVNLLTLPPLHRGVGLGALGDGVTLLRYLPWLQQIPIAYWGDIDVEGFEILSSLRAVFPQTCSLLMDRATLDRWQHLATCGTGRRPDVPPHLTEPEQAAYVCCRDQNLRLEQERLPQGDVLALFNHPAEANVRRVAWERLAPACAQPLTKTGGNGGQP